MPLDLKREIVFIHIPKTAGTAIEIALGIKAAGGISEEAILWGEASQERGGSKQHYTYEEILSAKPHVKSWPAFAVVRNPWDRMVSLYHFLKQDIFMSNLITILTNKVYK